MTTLQRASSSERVGGAERGFQGPRERRREGGRGGAAPRLLVRFARFNAVGALGIGVQLTVLWVLADLWDAAYLPATVVAVGAAILHNFLWHQRWTWRDRRPRGLAALKAFARFMGTNGAISLAGNAGVMVLLVEGARMNPVLANAIAIAATGLLNFAMSDVFVFEP